MPLTSETGHQRLATGETDSAPDQQLLWLSAEVTASASSYSKPVPPHDGTPFDRAVLARPYLKVKRRHEILGTAFIQVHSEVVQAVHAHLTTEIPSLDLSSFQKPQSEEKANKIAASDAKQPVAFGIGTWIRARVWYVGKRSTKRLSVTA